MLRESILTPDALSPVGVAEETLSNTGKSTWPGGGCPGRT